MANKDEPSHAGLVGHYVGCMCSAVQARKALPAAASKEAKAAVDSVIQKLAASAERYIEMDRAQGAN